MSQAVASNAPGWTVHDMRSYPEPPLILEQVNETPAERAARHNLESAYY